MLPYLQPLLKDHVCRRPARCTIQLDSCSTQLCCKWLAYRDGVLAFSPTEFVRQGGFSGVKRLAVGASNRTREGDGQCFGLASRCSYPHLENTVADLGRPTIGSTSHTRTNVSTGPGAACERTVVLQEVVSESSPKCSTLGGRMHAYHAPCLFHRLWATGNVVGGSQFAPTTSSASCQLPPTLSLCDDS